MTDSRFEAIGIEEQIATWEKQVTDPRGSVPTLIPELDSLLYKKGIQFPTFCILTGRTRTRKTTVTMNMIRLFLQQGLPVGLVGLDESQPSYIKKLASAITGVSAEWIEENWDAPVGKKLLQVFGKRASLFTMSKGYRPTLDDLTYWRKEAEITGSAPKVVFIDYLSLLSRDKYSGAEVQRIGRLMEEVQKWTLSQQVITIVLHQVGRADEGNGLRYHGDTPMSLEAMKYGGEEMADLVFGTYRPALDPLGNVSYEDAVAIMGDKYEKKYWETRVERVERYRDSTMLQLLKNRPGTKTCEQGIELFSVGDSMAMLSQDMGGHRGMRAANPLASQEEVKS